MVLNKWKMLGYSNIIRSLDEGEYRILPHMCFHEAPDEWMTNEPDENDFYIAYEFLVESKNSD